MTNALQKTSVAPVLPDVAASGGSHCEPQPHQGKESEMSIATAVVVPPPKCLRPGVWRHWAPRIEDVDLHGEEGVRHVMVTCHAGRVVGHLVRWVWADGDTFYESEIEGTDDSAGTCDISAADIRTLACLAAVPNDLRYEWEIITGVYDDREWTYRFVSRWPNEVYPDA